MAAGLVPKGRTVTSLRGNPVQYMGGFILLTFDPGVVDRDYERLPDIQWDTMLAIRLHSTGSIKPVVGVYRYVTELDDLINRVHEKFEATGVPVELACDLETLGLVEYDPEAWIISISFTIDAGASDILYFKKGEVPEGTPAEESLPWYEGGVTVYSQIEWLLTTDMVSLRGANWKYDSKWLSYKWKLHCTNSKFDTVMVGSLLDENRSNSLKLHSKVMTPLGGYDEVLGDFDKGRMDLVPRSVLLQYCLTGDSLVQLEDESWRTVQGLVTDKYDGHVRCFDGYSITSGRVVGWHRNSCDQKEWYKLITPTTLNGRWGPIGPALTPEHHVYTDSGKVQVQDLKLGHRILTQYRWFSSDQLSVVLGSLLGDGGLRRKNGKGVGFGFSQKIERRAYAEWKAQVLSDFAPKPYVTSHSVRYETSFNPSFAEVDRTYETKSSAEHRYCKAVITPTLLRTMGVLGLAVWYQDDGCVERTKGVVTASRIAAKHLSGSEISTVVAWLEGMFGHGVTYNKKQAFVRIGKPALVGFHEAVAPYMHIVMGYKCTRLDLIGSAELNTSSTPYYEPLLSKVPYKYGAERRGGGVRWCIEVEKHHNFVTSVGVVSNCGGDTDATLRVAKVEKELLRKDPVLANFYVKLMHPASKVFEKMERVGVLVDLPYYRELQAELNSEIARLHAEMLELVPRKIKFKYHEDLKITRPALLKEFMFSDRGLGLKPLMFTEKTQEPSTAIDHLLMFADNPKAKEFVDLLKQYGSANKTLSTYVVGFLKHLRPDGRFHGSYVLHRDGGGEGGAVTGRTSCTSPALQTIPKKTKWTKRLRRAFIAPAGYAILQLDYSQGELRIAACLANELTMLKAYASNADLHSVTAAKLAGYEYEEFMLLPEEVRDPFRTMAKPSNFGLLYGMGAAGYQVYANTSYGLSLTLEDATKHRTAFFDLYSGLLDWHKEYKNRARVAGQVRSPLGRIRHLPLINSSDRMAVAAAERQAVNSPVQSTLSDMMQWSMVLIDKQYGEEDIHMFLMTHDSLALYVPIGTEVLWAKRLKEIMENLPFKKEFGWSPQLKFTVDAECSVLDVDGVHSMANLKKMKGL